MATSDDFLKLIEKIPCGKVATYGMIANWAGSPGGGMAVGGALRNRPTGRNVPWHRVVSGSRARGFLSPMAPQNQRELLADEGVTFGPGDTVDLTSFAWAGPKEGLGTPANCAVQKFNDLPTASLLELFADVLDEIKRRGISRGNNHPQADWAEILVAKALNATVQRQSTAGFDLLGPNGEKYEVKSRRVTGGSGERQLSAIRKIEEKRFDYLVGVLFHANYRVFKAAIIPHSIVIERSRYSGGTNCWLFHLTDDVWGLPGVADLSLDASVF